MDGNGVNQAYEHPEFRGCARLGHASLAVARKYLHLHVRERAVAESASPQFVPTPVVRTFVWDSKTFRRFGTSRSTWLCSRQTGQVQS